MHKIGTERKTRGFKKSVRNPFSNVLMTIEDNPEKQKYDASYDDSEEKTQRKSKAIYNGK